MKKSRVTRGFGLLENILARKRSRMANALIPGSLRKGRLLDIGCGVYPYFLLNTIFNERYGIDQSPGITRSREVSSAGNSLDLRQWDFGREADLPFGDDFFDVVTMLAVFEHIDRTHIGRLVSEIHRVLKKGGLFIITTPAPWTDRLLRLLARLKLVSPVEIRDHKDTYSHKKIIRILEGSGFKKENITLGYFEMLMNTWGKIKK
ncbi:MAG: class I SAM-dependent methyltransferase [Candidatus Aminicenantes bacterium]|nr:MAG: class I SAM-dependent methyltransferase [Candidatus Aminicenantes bacterium]